MNNWNVARPLIVKPNSLLITKLETDDCAILKSDMQTLILACPKLRSLLYWTGSEETGPSNFTAAELTEVLDPMKDTLEELQAEIRPYWDEFGENEGRIDTMSHFTALKTLDTTPEMWWNLLADDFEGNFGLVGLRPITDEQRFASRLPSSLQTLRLHVVQTHEEMHARYPISRTLDKSWILSCAHHSCCPISRTSSSAANGLNMREK